MTKIQFPAPTEVSFVPEGKRSPTSVTVEHWVDVEFLDVDETEAPIVARVDKDFPDGVFANSYKTTTAKVPYERPKTSIRVHAGEFYVPLYSYDRTMERLKGESAAAEGFEPERAGVDNFLRGYAENRSNVSVFQPLHGIPGNLGWLAYSSLKEIPKQLRDELPKIGNLNGKIGESNRAFIEDQVGQMVGSLILINGEFWVKIVEPTVTAVINEANGTAKVDLARFSNFDGRYDENYHSFRLDRLNDCLAHVAENFPQNRITMCFGELEVLMPEALRYEDELQPIHGAAIKVVDYSKPLLDRMGTLQALAWYDLRDAVEPYRQIGDEEKPLVSEVTGEKVATALAAFNEASVTGVDVKPYSFALAAVERWKWRPQRERGMVPGIQRW